MSWSGSHQPARRTGSFVTSVHVSTGNGILEMGQDPNTLGISDGICSTSPTYLENNCTCAVGLTYFETCTSPIEFCRYGATRLAVP
jgi:hypothetical protein